MSDDDTNGRRTLAGGQVEYLWRMVPGRRHVTEWRLRASRGGCCLTLRGNSRSRQGAAEGWLYLDELAELLSIAGKELYAEAHPEEER